MTTIPQVQTLAADVCQDWCDTHATRSDGTLVHLSSLDISSKGTASALRMVTDGGGELVGQPSLLVLRPSSEARLERGVLAAALLAA